MRSKELSETALFIDDDNWYYEEAGGIVVFHEIRGRGRVYLRTDRVPIPWQMLTATMKRYDAATGKVRRKALKTKRNGKGK